MTRTEIVGHLKTLTTNMNVFALAIWLDGFLSERNTAPLLRCPNNPNLAEGSWLALYLHDLPPELQTKFMDAVLILLENLPKVATTKGRGTDYVSYVILLLEEAPATNIDSAIKLIRSIEENSTLESMKWTGGIMPIKEFSQRARQAQKRFQAQGA